MILLNIIINLTKLQGEDIAFIYISSFKQPLQHRIDRQILRKKMLYLERQAIDQREESLPSYQQIKDCSTTGLELPITFLAAIIFVVTVVQLLEKHSAHVRFLTWLTHLSNEIKKIAFTWPINQCGSSAKITKQSQLVVDCIDAARCAGTKGSSKEVDEPDELLNETRWIVDSNWVKKSNLWVCTVAQYPENHNPVIPLTLQKELDQKTHREYLTYIKNDLTTEERESLMVDERERRRTFQTQWPHDGTLSGMKMAEAGFYYLGEGDQVQCVFCRGRLRNWSQHEVPMTEHARLFNFCQFVKGLNCGNREYRSKKVASEDMANITVFGNLTDAEQKQQQEIGTDSGPLGICTNRAAVIKYAPDSARLRTFQRWPASSPLTGEQVCEAGFYYTGFGDQVRCFYCLGGIKGWTVHDEPWEEHARWFPDCSYLLNKKGTAFVDLVHQRTPDNKKCTTKTKMQKRAEWKKNAAISEQEAMPEICEKLGHDRQTIAKALADNNNHFESVKDLVNAVHALEDAGEEPMRRDEITPTSVSVSHPLQEHNPPAQQPADQQIGQLQQSERQTKHKAGCKICELKTTNFVPATNVGLPCGHLIYCDSCKTDESKKSVIQQVKCPYSGCNSPLSGTIKVFFA
ncbi:baculoviral IAP repeat-containing protein 7-like [Watersipora subatra]|uniref:baculoviral IAP repeat-containing protein 7-like n=1 Tax=Watersipora subatra TaxID=2589382 RepID=UPI00355AFAF5